MLRRLLALLGLAGGGVAAVLAYSSRRGRRPRVDVHFDDGSFVTFSARSAEGQRLLPIARDILTAARS
jgi:hypothetical protein